MIVVFLSLSPPPPQENRKQYYSLAQKAILDIRQRIEKSNKIFVVAFSGGKDSTVVLQLVYEALCSLPKEKQRKTYAIASNTLVEPPHIEKYLKETIASINSYSKKNDIPFEVLEVAPSENDQFWVNLIGKGYPSPTRTFRWCTDRLKIAPSKKTIEKIARKEGSVILCLGVRKSESVSRQKSIQKRILNEEGYSLHEDFANTLIYSPIKDWSTDDVWAYLLSNPPRWEKKHDELFGLYTKASGDECQFITDLKQSSCGGSRFGCWVCTVVNEDKSMQGFIYSGEDKLKPLNDFRNFIKEAREDPNMRSDYKRDGRAIYKMGGKGPFLSSARIQIFRKLLECEREFVKQGGKYLISDSQIEEIQKQWSKDFDFSSTAIKIAKEFKRMLDKDIDVAHKILHEEILEEIASDEKNIELGLNQEDFKNLIASSVEIINNRIKSKVDMGIKQEIEKLIADKTSKEEEESVY